MKIVKKTIAMFTAGLLLFGAVACGKNNNGNSTTDVQVYYWRSGLGSDFIDAIVKDFNASQDTYTVTVDSEESASTIINSLALGKSNTYDLYFTMLNTYQYNSQFITLDDVLDSKADGESVSIREKYYSYLLDGVKNADGTTNFLTYGNQWCGIVYNREIIDGNKYKVPNTTNELDKLVTRLNGDSSLTEKTSGFKPWIFYNNTDNNGYINYLTMIWEAQYDGLDYYNNTMLALKDESGNSPSKEVFLKKDGRYQALKTLQGMLTSETAHAMSTSTLFTTVQRYFLNGEAALMVNGGWLLNESSGDTEKFLMMKTPVISSIVEKLEDSSMTDETLSAIITEVDEGKTSSTLCSQNDFDRIKEARNILYNNASEQYVFIPDYSSAIDGAKTFLKYFYSDKGIKKYIETTKLPSSAKLSDESLFSTSSLDAWHERQFDLTKTTTAITNTLTKSSVFVNNSLNQFASISYAQAFIAKNKSDYKDVDGVWALITDRINKNWSDWIK